jgi:hypothetical protein
MACRHAPEPYIRVPTPIAAASRRANVFLALTLAGLSTGCASAGALADAPRGSVSPPYVVPGSDWRAEAPVGIAAEANRRNLRPADSLAFLGLRLRVESLWPEPTSWSGPAVLLVLDAGDAEAARVLEAGSAMRWRGYRVALLAVHGAGELGAGLAELEVATLASLPEEVARSPLAGDATYRLRIPHDITHITLHHSGSPQPLRPEDDVVAKLQRLQAWGETDRNWWDVPYHFLIGLDGTIYEGRDWHYMGETNTTYDPHGHLLISVVGNYNVQETTPAQLEAIADLMAWAAAAFHVPLDRIGGHYDYADTTCPGLYLRRYLEDGSFLHAVEARLRATRSNPGSP